MPMLDCHDAMRQLFDYLDGELTPARMEAIREHLATCRHCHPHAQFERAFLDAVRSLRSEEPMPKHLRVAVLARLQVAGLGTD
jgi:anti-sigma factor (TIGR02949 family)